MICLIRSVKNWSSFRASSSISNVKTTLYSITNNFAGAHCSIAFSIWMVTIEDFIHRLRPSYNQLAQQNKQEHRNVLLRSQFFSFLTFDKNVHVSSWPWTAGSYFLGSFRLERFSRNFLNINNENLITFKLHTWRRLDNDYIFHINELYKYKVNVLLIIHNGNVLKEQNLHALWFHCRT